MKKISYSIVIPAYNEEENIKTCVEQVLAFAKKFGVSHELIIVENGSNDKTYEILTQLKQKYNNLVVIKMKEPGYGKALLKGMNLAKGKYVVIYNVDFWDPRFIQLTEIDLLGYDIVLGSKALPGSHDNRPFWRKMTTKIFNQFLRVYFDFEGTDTHGIKVLNRESIMPIVKKCKTDGGIFDTEFMIRSSQMGRKTLEIPVDIVEIRPTRFKMNRIFQTPNDIYKLVKAING